MTRILTTQGYHGWVVFINLWFTLNPVHFLDEICVQLFLRKQNAVTEYSPTFISVTSSNTEAADHF